MANNYSPAAGYDVVACSRDDYKKLSALLEWDGLSGDTWAGFEVEFDEEQNGQGVIHFFAGEGCCPDHLSNEALKQIGSILQKAKKPWLKVGVAMYCDKMRPADFGGYDFKIGQDGSLVYPTIVWPTGYEDD